MAGKPRAPGAPPAPFIEAPPVPERWPAFFGGGELTELEMASWEQARAEVNELGTYMGKYREFCSMVKLDAEEVRLYQRGLENLDTPATRVISTAFTKRDAFGRNPRTRVVGGTRREGGDPDSEFTEGGPRPQLRAVPTPEPTPKAKTKAAPVATPAPPPRKPWEKSA